MEPAEALKILRRLAEGEDPATGEIFSAESVLKRPEIVRALHSAIHILEKSPRTRTASRLNPSDPSQNCSALSELQKQLYARLRAWRSQKAEELLVPAYVIAHNRWLLQMVALPVRTEEDFARISGFGKSRTQKYGSEILEILNVTALKAPCNDPSRNSHVLENPDIPDITDGEKILPETKREHTIVAVCVRRPEGGARTLLLTEVTKMQHDNYCIAGFDIHSGKMVRPLRQRGGNWQFDDFQAAYFPGQLVRISPGHRSDSLYPHRNEDLKIIGGMEPLEVWPEPELWTALLPFAKDTISEVFNGRPVEDRYYPEGVRCSSLGSVAVTRRRIQFCLASENCLRLRIEDGENITYSLPVTCRRLRTLFHPADRVKIQEANRMLEQIPPEESVLLRVGLTRGYAGENGDFNPKRCFVQINGVICSRSVFGDYIDATAF